LWWNAGGVHQVLPLILVHQNTISQILEKPAHSDLMKRNTIQCPVLAERYGKQVGYSLQRSIMRKRYISCEMERCQDEMIVMASDLKRFH
jgi:hypothetical protein